MPELKSSAVEGDERRVREGTEGMISPRRTRHKAASGAMAPRVFVVCVQFLCYLSYCDCYSTPSAGGDGSGSGSSTNVYEGLLFANSTTTTTAQTDYNLTSTITSIPRTGTSYSPRSSSETRVRYQITLGGIGSIEVEGKGYSGGGVVPALEMAIEDINSREDILTDYELILDMKDSKCDPGLSVKHLFDHIRTPPVKVMIVGGGCSVATAPVARTVHFYNLIQVGYSVGSPELSQPETFPTFFRTSASDLALNLPIMRILDYYKWHRVATIIEIDPLFSLSVDQLHLYMNSDNKSEIVTAESFKASPATHLDNIKRKDARIIVFNGYGAAARRVFCEAYLRGMYGARYQWLIPGWFIPGWMNVNDTDCTTEQLHIAINSTFAFENLNRDTSGDVTDARMTFDEYDQRYHSWPSFRKYGENNYHGCGYDAILSLALALNGTIEKIKHQSVPDGAGGYRSKRLDDFTYSDSEMALHIFTNLENTRFHGVSGPVSFNARKDRRAITLVKQYQNGEEVPIAIHYDETDDLVFNNGTQSTWNGLGPPLDRVTIYVSRGFLNQTLFISVSVLSGLGILMAIGFLLFNIINYNHKHIKMSSPKLNNLIIVGCLLGYFAIIIHGIDGRYITSESLQIICTVRTWTLSVAFTLAFGAMFAKTWRVHAIFTSRAVVKKGALHDVHLISMVGVLLIVDICVLTAWQFVDPVFVQTRNGTTLETQTAMIIEQTEFCFAVQQYYWVGALYVEKGLLLLFGCFLAYETRSVQVPGLNDSKFIGICVYNVVVMCLVGVAISLVLYEKIDIAFTFTAFTILISCTVTLCLLFIPKISTVLNWKKLGGTESGSSTFQYTMKSVRKQAGSQSEAESSHGEEDSNPNKWKTIVDQKTGEIDILTKKLKSLEKLLASTDDLSANNHPSTAANVTSRSTSFSIPEEDQNIPVASQQPTGHENSTA